MRLVVNQRYQILQGLSITKPRTLLWDILIDDITWTQKEFQGNNFNSTHKELVNQSFDFCLLLFLTSFSKSLVPLQWRHDGHDCVSNHHPHDCLLTRLFKRRSKKTSKHRVAGLYAGNSLVTGEFPAQMASDAENVSIWWRHHAQVDWPPPPPPPPPQQSIRKDRKDTGLKFRLYFVSKAQEHGGPRSHVPRYKPLTDGINCDLKESLLRNKAL